MFLTELFPLLSDPTKDVNNRDSRISVGNLIDENAGGHSSTDNARVGGDQLIKRVRHHSAAAAAAVVAAVAAASAAAGGGGRGREPNGGVESQVTQG